MNSLVAMVALLACLASACAAYDPCANTVITETSAPGGKMKVVVFERDCGATTDSSTQVSVMRTGDSIAENTTWFRATQSGNAFIADTDHGRAPSAPWGGPRVRVEWLDPEHLHVAYDKAARVFLSASEVAGVTIDYTQGPA